MELIETIEVGSGGAASIEFTSIPQDGTDLVLVMSVKSNSASSSTTNFRFNSDSGSSYYSRGLSGNGSSVTSWSYGPSTSMRCDFSISESDFTGFSSLQLYVPNYTSSSEKAISVDAVAENNATQGNQAITAGRWTGTTAITSLTCITATLEFSTASLYKITKA